MLAKIDFFNNFLGDYFRGINNLNSRDFFDILIIAFLIYAVIKFIRETHSISAVIGLLTLLGFYGAALLFDLPLTSLVLRSFFAIFLVVIAIIFQRELRRFFSTFGFMGVARRLMPLPDATIETVVYVASRLAREKTGALIVFPGRESIDRQIEGGFRLDGEISKPLLFSIFDKTSPGHDGAAIIENNRVKKFAVHLPLAENIEKVRHFGLRHRAALGLAERSDALIVVVSEERGVISVVQNKRLRQIENRNELKQGLVDFYREKFPRLNMVNFSRWLAKNIFLLAFSFLIALGIFFLVNSRFVLVQRNFAVSPEFGSMPSEILINDIVPQEVILTLQGRGSDFDAFNSENLRVSIDAGAISNIKKIGWHRVPIGVKDIKLPFNLSVIKIDPPSIQVQVVKNASSLPAAK